MIIELLVINIEQQENLEKVEMLIQETECLLLFAYQKKVFTS